VDFRLIVFLVVVVVVFCEIDDFNRVAPSKAVDALFLLISTTATTTFCLYSVNVIIS